MYMYKLTGLTKKHADAVRLRLRGHTYAEIAEKLGLGGETAVAGRLKAASRFLHPKTIARLSGRRTNVGMVAKRQEAVELFLRGLANATPVDLSSHFAPEGGLVARVARELDVPKTTMGHRLRAGGVNPIAEIQRKRLDFMLIVEATMDRPVKEVMAKLKCSKPTVNKYRRLVREGRHVTGALELVESPEAEQWWDIRVPTVRGRINLTVRNETVRKDLAFFDNSIAKATEIQTRNHPDKKPGDVEAVDRFRRAGQNKERLQERRAEYIDKERQFRKRLGIPLLKELE